MIWWFWDWHENKYITKIKKGIVFYEKPKKNEHVKSFRKKILNRRIVSKRVFTNMKK